MARNMHRYERHHNDCENTMNVMTRILNALVFANAGNQNSFNILLRQVNLSSDPLQNRIQCSPVSTRTEAYSATTPIRHAHGAL